MKHFFWVVCILGTTLLFCALTCAEPIKQARRICRKPRSIIDNPIKDIIDLNINIVSWDTLKVLAYSAPLYAVTRAFDEDIHHCFYKSCCHKNLHQFPRDFEKMAAKGIGVPLLLFGGCAFFANREKLRITSRIFLLGWPFVLFGKELIKTWEADHCLRPRCEYFSRKRVHGGFPSGHMAQAIYTTVLFGKQFGPPAWIPLGAYSAFLFATFVNCNRHYSSQMVAGAALGAIYGLAASKLVDTKLAKSLDFSAGISPKGNAEMKVGFSF